MGEISVDKWPSNEAELAAAIVSWLEENQWDCYQEVSFLGRSIDIVAKQGPVLWAIECKMTFGLDVIGQAEYWLQYAHKVSVVVPWIKDWNRRKTAARILDKFGIGLIYGRDGEQSELNQSVKEEISPTFRRRILTNENWKGYDLAKSLCVEQKTFALAGTPSPKFWTPFKATCRDVAAYVQQNPGASFKQVLDNVPTHYSNKSSARSNLSIWIESGKVDGIRLERDGRNIFLHPTTAATTE